MADSDVAYTELEVWRLAHRVGAEFVERVAGEAGLPETVIAGARMYRDYVEQVLVEAGYPPATTTTVPPPAVQCRAEVHSWQHFTPQQLDSYWIQCTLSGPHGEHKDEHTGLTWSDQSAGGTETNAADGEDRG